MLGATQPAQVAAWIGDDVARLGAREVRASFDDAIEVITDGADAGRWISGLVKDEQRGFPLVTRAWSSPADTGDALTPQLAAAILGGGDGAGRAWQGLDGVLGARVIAGTRPELHVQTVSPHRASQLRSLLRDEVAAATVTVESAPIRTVWPPS